MIIDMKNILKKLMIYVIKEKKILMILKMMMILRKIKF